MKKIQALLVLLIASVYALYFVHLGADFPAFVRWNDWARYTDEGWYTSAAIQHVLTGRWYFPSGFNPVVALPVWPALMRLWFAIVGCSMVSERVLAVLLMGGSLLMLYSLLRRTVSETTCMIAILLFLLCPYNYAFARMAFLEPLVIFLFFLGLFICTLRLSSWVRAAAVGVVLCAMLLTKTTALTLAPAMLLFLMDSCNPGVPLRTTVRNPCTLAIPGLAIAIASLLMGAYFLLLVRPHYIADFRNIFHINAYHANLRILPEKLAIALADLRVVDPYVAVLVLVLLLMSLWWFRDLWSQPLFRASALAVACYVFYIGWHGWLSQRYYAPCAFLLTCMLAIGVQRMQHSRVCFPIFTVVLALAAIIMTISTLRWIAHPTYTFRDASLSIARHMKADTGVPTVLASPSSDDLALYSGIHTWNPTWPTQNLDVLLQQNPLGWYAAWVPQEASLSPAITNRYDAREIERWTAMPDEIHQYLVLYRLTPRTSN
ncbi:glycosyltransferase family 39 protein [Terriglobus roseus]|uniref:Dolichyl-phosphate-mannose-protein mannosyltransferase n=1 Tax=Terriglobus roseus TaxID=392734 RepID=A0A1G7Q7L6_9BACT|nr:glycosyltransferase family 39 protein [Terriglobus roseus]SDF94484.1 Dolichyl-phosphate-mannose-protein mannosyltransferase [Terriglobus roseus]